MNRIKNAATRLVANPGVRRVAVVAAGIVGLVLAAGIVAKTAEAVDPEFEAAMAEAKDLDEAAVKAKEAKNATKAKVTKIIPAD